MSDFSQIIDLADEKLIAIHKNLHGDIADSAVVEAHHLVTTEMTRRGLDHGHVDDEWSMAQVEIDSVQSVDLEDVTTSLSDELAVEVAKTIPMRKFDGICFTGSTEKGKLVAEAAAKNLIPCVLELGGKSPIIVDKGSEVDFAAKKIAFGRFMNAG